MSTVENKEMLRKATEVYEISKEMSVDEVNAQLEGITSLISALCPFGIISATLRLTKDEAHVEAIEFLCKIRKREGVTDLKKRKFNVLVTSHTVEDIVEDLSSWYDLAEGYIEDVKKLESLNEGVSEIIAENEIPFSVVFTPSDNKIVDVADDYIVIGLTEAVINEVYKLPLFNDKFESIKEKYKVIIADTLKECARPYDIFTKKTVFTRDLDLVTRVKVAKLIRKVCSKQAKNVRDGVGYVDVDGTFALVERYFVSKAEAAELAATKGEPVHTQEKHCDSKKLKDKEMIVSYYKVSPFRKDTLEADELVLDF